VRGAASRSSVISKLGFSTGEQFYRAERAVSCPSKRMRIPTSHGM
jgi:hypothetical protein